MELADRLRTELALYGLRPADVARRTGLNEGYLSRVLGGQVTPTPATLTRIVLAVHSDYLGPAQPAALATEGRAA
jgi:transcriptional regulator with XRE-family HTH domain